MAETVESCSEYSKKLLINMPYLAVVELLNITHMQQLIREKLKTNVAKYKAENSARSFVQGKVIDFAIK